MLVAIGASQASAVYQQSPLSLFKRAYELGYERGEAFMAAAYNYYLHACDEDQEKFSYHFEEGKPVWRPTASGGEIDVLKCGFDPRPYFSSPNSQARSAE